VKLTDGIYCLNRDRGGHVHAFYDDDGRMIPDEIRAMGRQPSDLNYRHPRGPLAH
jgi:hypothetical protein